MANLPEQSSFDEAIYQIEITDPVIGGPNGISNRASRSLANRTRWLKDEVARVAADKAPLNAPAFTGAATFAGGAAFTGRADVTAPRPADADDSFRVATTSWVRRVAAPLAHVGAAGDAHPVATRSTAGFMSPADKAKLDGVASGAQANAVTSVAGRAGVVTLTVADVTGAAPLNNPRFSGTVNVATNSTVDLNEEGVKVYVPNRRMSALTAPEAVSKIALEEYAAPIASPTFTGTPRAPEAAETENSTRIATTSWVWKSIARIARSAGFYLFGGYWVNPHAHTSGWIDMPSWLGGFRMQWASGRVASGTEAGANESFYHLAIAFPLAFREGYYFVQSSAHPGSGRHFTAGPRVGLNNKTHVYINMGGPDASDSRCVVFAIGR